MNNQKEIALMLMEEKFKPSDCKVYQDIEVMYLSNGYFQIRYYDNEDDTYYFYNQEDDYMVQFMSEKECICIFNYLLPLPKTQLDFYYDFVRVGIELKLIEI